MKADRNWPAFVLFVTLGVMAVIQGIYSARAQQRERESNARLMQQLREFSNMLDDINEAQRRRAENQAIYEAWLKEQPRSDERTP